MIQPVRLECRWCKRKLPKKWRDAHEMVCLAEARQDQSQRLMAAFVRVEELRRAPWYRERWRSLPGKGWGALAGSYQLVEVLS